MQTEREKEITKKAKEFQRKYLIPGIISFFTSAFFTVLIIKLVHCHK